MENFNVDQKNDFLKIIEKWQRQEDLIVIRGEKSDGIFAFDSEIKSPIWEIDFSFMGEDGECYTDEDKFIILVHNAKMIICFSEKGKYYGLSAKKFCGINKMRLFVRTLRESLLVYINREEGFAPIIEWNLDCPYYKNSQKQDEWVSNLYLALVHGKEHVRKREVKEAEQDTNV